MKSTSSRFRWWIVLLLGVVWVGSGLLRRDWTPEEKLFQQTQTLLRLGKFAEAEQAALRLTKRSTRVQEGWMLAADAAARQRRLEDAAKYLSQIPDDGSQLSAARWQLVGTLELQGFHRLAAAEAAFRKVLQVDPSNLEAHANLASILSWEGRHWDATPHRMTLVKRGQADLMTLVFLALANSAIDNPEEFSEYARLVPDDAGSLCGRARQLLIENQTAEARKLLLRMSELQPEWITPRCWLGSIDLAENDLATFDEWMASLPSSAAEHPDVWFLRGRRALLDANHSLAGQCWSQALRIDPNHLAACYQLGQLLSTTQKPDAAQTFLDRAKRLSDYLAVAKSYVITQQTSSLAKASALADSLGLTIEAAAWHDMLANWGIRSTSPRRVPAEPRQAKPDAASATDHLQTSHSRISREVAEQMLAGLPPDWRTLPRITKTSPSTRVAESLASKPFRARFVDRAADIGLQFSYFNGNRSETKGQFMYEFSGGGVAILDYDLDGWSDAYLTQGSDWPASAITPRLDQLFRNVEGQRFQSVTDAARVVEPNFSQGVTVGDYDNDGFPDLFVANIGLNRFFRNNGDGTFEDVTAETGTAGSYWSTSCALADFNNDGLPDLYVVNYVEGEQLFERPCRLPDGSVRLCTPHEFEASHDQLFVNLGDGRFRDVTQAAGVQIPNGKGLGIVVADFEQRGWLDAFVANDAVPNFHFRNAANSAGQEIRFDECAFTSGLALDEDGHAEACMGIAAGDADGDGRLDLFVTNFHRESNTLYLQRSSGQFDDATRKAHLEEPSLPMLGFGTQFLDIDLDGRRDLVVANGHVGDLRHHGIPYQMVAQCFWNRGGGQFAELTADDAGPFFQPLRLGRGLARWDWNRDGREDFLVSDLEAPASVASNESTAVGNFVAIELRGRVLDRDAIGTEVRVRCGERSWIQQLTAGDGYQASNERRLIFGIGNATQVDDIEIRWRSGRRQTLTAVPANSQWLIVEDTAAIARNVASSTNSP